MWFQLLVLKDFRKCPWSPNVKLHRWRVSPPATRVVLSNCLRESDNGPPKTLIPESREINKANSMTPDCYLEAFTRFQHRKGKPRVWETQSCGDKIEFKETEAPKLRSAEHLRQDSDGERGLEICRGDYVHPSSRLSNVLSVKLRGPGKESPGKEQLPRTW